jgi:hypothetical protein
VLSNLECIDSRPQLYQVIKTAVEELPETIPLTLDREDQQYNIARAAGLASFAAGLALANGEPPFEALRIVEMGRGVVASR